jgi:hypothetical protein
MTMIEDALELDRKLLVRLTLDVPTRFAAVQR